MKKITLLIACITAWCANAQTITFNDPDFKNALLNHVPPIDTNADGEIQASEALAVTHLELLLCCYEVLSGSFTLTPVLENPYYTISPSWAMLDFQLLDSSTQTANFCLTPNGIHNDLEVSVMSITPARPGFDADYLITYKNKATRPYQAASHWRSTIR